MNVIFHYSAGPGLTSRLAALERDGLSVSVCAMSDHDRFAALRSDAEALWHLLEPVTADVMAAAPRLRLIQKIGVGVNTIDLEAARRRGIAVCNMPGTNSQAVAEMTLLLILGALRRVGQLDAATRAGRGWGLPAALQDRCGEGERADCRAGRLRRRAARSGAGAAGAGGAHPVRQPWREA